MNIADETLMAYVDGELEPAARMAIEAAMASDPEVARRIEQHRVLRRRLQATFGGIVEEAVPERLIAAVRAAPAGLADSSATAPAATDLNQARMRKLGKAADGLRRRSWPVWGAMAASLVLGLIIGRAELRSPPFATFSASDGRLIADGDLAHALSSQLANQQAAAAPIQIGLSFRAKSGGYCRTFTLRQGTGISGLACRAQDEWALQVLAGNDRDTPSGDYRPASTDLPAAIVTAVEQQISGEPLDAAGEAAVQRNGWRADDH